jgi:hypothetical protein
MVKNIALKALDKPRAHSHNWMSKCQPHLDLNGLSVIMGKDTDIAYFVKDHTRVKTLLDKFFEDDIENVKHLWRERGYDFCREKGSIMVVTGNFETILTIALKNGNNSRFNEVCKIIQL